MTRWPFQAPKTSSAALAGWVVCVAAVVPYLSTLNDYFVRDDFGVVQLLAGKAAGSFPGWFVSSWMDDIWGYVPDEIRPFPALSFQLTALAGAASPLLHHAFNIGLHAANGWLVLAIAREAAGLSNAASMFAGLVFVLLPVGAESVAWITGRVDSMPALFYMASFLCYARWRRSRACGAGASGGEGSRSSYIGGLTWFFLALFTKQNAITLVATLVAYDVLLRPGSTRRWGAVAYAPFLAMTAGYLWLRYQLFGEFAREGGLSPEGLSGFVGMADRHLAHVAAGDVASGRVGVLLALGVLAASWAVARWTAPSTHGRVLRSLLFFGPVWWSIGVAPILVAGYESPRHVYLAAVGWAIVLGVMFDQLWRVHDGAAWRRLVVLAATAVLGFYAIRLNQVVDGWNAVAAVSEKVTGDVHAEARALPRGSLLIVGPPVQSWEWAIPFALGPPYVPEDLTDRILVVSPNWLHCCRSQWFEHTRATLLAWSAQESRSPVVAMRWDAAGALSKVSSLEEPALAAAVPVLLDLQSRDKLDETILKTLAYLAPDRGGTNGARR